MLMPRPKFKENDEWYYNDETHELSKLLEIKCYRLTDKAPKEAVESYLSFCTQIYLDELGYVPEFVNEEYRKHMQRFL